MYEDICKRTVRAIDDTMYALITLVVLAEERAK